MDFRLTEEQVMFKETARKFAETEIAPLIPQMEEKQRTPPELIKKMRELSFYAIQYPAEYGGVGSTYLEYAMVIEQLSRVYCSIGGHISVNCLCAGTINDFGTVEQKKKYLPEIIAGDAVGSFAFTEPSTGSDPGAIRTTCVRDGNDWVINGEKIFITNSTLPGYIVVFCKDVEKDNKITNIIVPKNTKGYSTPKLVEKMGMNGMEVADVVLEDVRVPFENTTGGEAGRGKGFPILTTEIADRETGDFGRMPGHGPGRSRRSHQVCQGENAKRKADLQFSDHSVAAGRNVVRRGGFALLHIRPGLLEIAEEGHSLRFSQNAPVCLSGLPSRNQQCHAGSGCLFLFKGIQRGADLPRHEAGRDLRGRQ